MLMFLMIVFSSVVAMAVCWVLFTSAAPNDESRPLARLDERIAIGAPRFFATDAHAGLDPGQVPVELLVDQIERHVRLEQAAAESFLAGPSREALHSRTASPFVN